MVKKIHRFITDFTSEKGIIKVTDKETVHQIGRVLKLNQEERIIIGKGDGLDVLAKIVKVDKNAMYLKLQQIIKNESEPARYVTLYCSILKKDNFETAVQKATEIGISQIVPIITKRTVKTDINSERLSKIIKESAEQSGRGKMPELGDIVSLEKAVEVAGEGDVIMFLEPCGSRFSPVGKDVKIASIFIGPEGGWVDEEIDMAKKAGFKIVSLCPLVMRAETAATIASYLVIHSCLD